MAVSLLLGKNHSPAVVVSVLYSAHAFAAQFDAVALAWFGWLRIACVFAYPVPISLDNVGSQ